MKHLIVWVDVETTGLDPQVDKLLEVAAFVTDTDLNFLDGGGYQAVVQYDNPKSVSEIANDYVFQMHENTGLWGKLETGTPLRQVESELLAYIQSLAPEPRQARLAGNSVRLDANFLDYNTPSVTQHLHYRLLDVSSLGFEFYDVRGVPVFKKELTHSAKDDILESIAELKYLRTFYNKEDK